jgi:hypothetical protein
MKMNELYLRNLCFHSTLSCLTLNVYARHNCVLVCKTKNAVHTEVLELMKSVPKHRFKTAFKQFQHINKAYIKAYKIK